MKELTLRELNRLDNKPLFSVKDPISALTHFIGFVGAILVTIALLSSNNAFKILLFPTLGLPTMATFIPFLII